MDKARVQELRAELDRREQTDWPFAGVELCQLLGCEYPESGATDSLPDLALNAVLDERSQYDERWEADDDAAHEAAHNADHERLKRHARVLQLVIWILEDIIKEDLM